ncbi:MAG: lipid II flippase MurJ [Dehalococcoidia bacterium]
MTLLRASLLLLAVAGASKLTTLAADSYVAARFGLSADADAYLLAVGLLGALLGAPSETLRLALVPICGRYLRQGDRRRAAGVVALVLGAAVVVGGAAALALGLSAPWLAPLAAPGFEGATRDTAVQLTRMLAPALLLGLVMSVLLGVLHAQLRFGVPAVAGIGLSAGVIGGGVLLSDALGVSALAAGYVAGTGVAVLVLAWLARGLFREGAALRGARGELAPFVRLALPTGIAITIVSSGAVIERAVASATGAGNVAALGFAIKLVTQAGIISQSIWTPLTPLLIASGSGSRDNDPLLVAFSIKLVLLILTLATSLIIALREPLVAVILERGAFTAADTSKTATLLALHSGSLVGEGLFMVAVAALLSLYDATTRLVGSVLFIVAKVVLMFALAPVIGVAGVAIAASVSSLLAGAFSVAVLARRFPSDTTRDLLACGAKAALAGLVALAVAGVIAGLVSSASPSSNVVVLALGGLAATAAYLIVLLVLRVQEIETIFRGAQQRLTQVWSRP